MAMGDVRDYLRAGKELGLEFEALQTWVDKKMEEDTQRKSLEHDRKKEERELDQQRLETEKILSEMKLKEQESRRQMLETEKEVLNLRKENEPSDTSLNSSTTQANNPAIKVKIPRLPNFDDTKDKIDQYLQRFERHATANGYTKEMYSVILSSYLRGSALEVFNRMSENDVNDYDALKMALLRRFEITTETCRMNFRSWELQKGETYAQAAIRLDYSLKKWLVLDGGKKCDGDCSLWDLMLRDQLIKIFPKDLQIFVKDRKPKTVSEMAEIADRYKEARKLTQGSRKLFSENTDKLKNGSKSVPSAESTTSNEAGAPSAKKVCTYCKKPGHNVESCYKRLKDEKMKSPK